MARVQDFVREGNDLVYTAKISLAEALTDCAVQVVSGVAPSIAGDA